MNILLIYPKFPDTFWSNVIKLRDRLNPTLVI